MPEMHWRGPGFMYNACGPFTKYKEYKKLKKLEIYDIFIKKNLIKRAFNMIRFIESLRIT